MYGCLWGRSSHMKTLACQSLLAFVISTLLALTVQANSEEPDTTNWVQNGSGLGCTAVGVRANGIVSDPLNTVWEGDGMSGEPDRPTFKQIDETENGLNVVEFEEFTFRGIRSRLAFEIEVFSKREKITLTVSQLIYRSGTKEEIKSEQLTVKKSDFTIGANYVLELAIHERWVAQHYESFRSYQIECRLDWLEGN